MDVSIHAKTNDGLISVHDSVVSKTVLPIALVKVWHVGKNNRSAISFLNLSKFVVKPSQHVARVLENSDCFPVKLVADVVVQRNNLCLAVAHGLAVSINQRHGIVTPILELAPLGFIRSEKGLPSSDPLINSCVVSWERHPDDILRISVMVSNCWIDAQALKSLQNFCGCILHDLYIRVEVERVNVVRDSVTSPKYSVWVNFFFYVIQKSFESQLV